MTRLRGATLRPRHLQELLNAIGDAMLTPTAAPLASFIAGKVIQRLERTGLIDHGPDLRRRIPDGLDVALARAGRDRSCVNVARKLTEFRHALEWRHGRGGQFESMNFARSHSHATIVGPGGLEDRSDTSIGATFMQPYTRFPDHILGASRAFMLLAPGEVYSESSGWLTLTAGHVFAMEVGQQFAMRCSSTPFLVLWCNLEPAAL